MGETGLRQQARNGGLRRERGNRLILKKVLTKLGRKILEQLTLWETASVSEWTISQPSVSGVIDFPKS